MYDDDKERFRSLDGFLKNSIAEKNAQDKAIIRGIEEFKFTQDQRQSAAFQKRQRWAAEPRPDQNLLKIREVRAASVAEVRDGNSLKIIDDTTGEELLVRLYGVDAPELQQEHGIEAKQFLEAQVLGKKITFRVKAEKYAFRVMIWVDDGSVNLLMVQRGHAMKFLDFEDQYSDAFIRGELNAKASRLGIWSYASPPQPAWMRRLNLVQHRQKEKEKSQGPSLLESTAAYNKDMAKYEADIKLWRQKWYVKIFAPLGLASFLNPPRFGE